MMRVEDALDLILPALPPSAVGGGWADVGAGDGTFTRALSRALGHTGVVYAIDRDAHALRTLSRGKPEVGGAAIIARIADMADPAAWNSLALPPLDGLLIANALHFIPRAAQREVLERLASSLAVGGRLVVIEYEGRTANRWVPYPVDFEVLRDLAPRPLSPPARVASRPSAFGGSMYVALMETS